MKLLILTTLIAACAALPQYYPQPYRVPSQYYPDVRARSSLERTAAVLRSDSEVNENGYRFAFDTENGIQREETGVENNGIQAAGQYSYTGDDGQVYSVRYTADVNGFRAEGAHIPTPPPIPAAIARALQQNAADEARGIFDDGSYNDGKYNPGSVFALRSQTQYNQYPNQYNRQYVTPTPLPVNPAFRSYY